MAKSLAMFRRLSHQRTLFHHPVKVLSLKCIRNHSVSTAHGFAGGALFAKIDKSQIQLLEGAIQCLLRI
jgi:hypothetical protein